MSVSVIKKLRGFTLIELLIVIAVLGVLAAGVLIAINPGEQLARARDASRKTTIGQLNKAAQAYYTVRTTYPTADAAWITTLVSAGEIKSLPAATTYSIPAGTPAACSPAGQNGYCYNTNTGKTDAVIYMRLESGSENAKCSGTTADAYFLWSSVDGRAGVICFSSAGQPSAVQSYTYQ